MRIHLFAPTPDAARGDVPQAAASALAWLAALLLATAPWAARAADDDLPGRVGRIADFAGQLQLSPEDSPNEWEAVGLNYPVISGDNLWVSGDGRAEVDYGGGQFRIAGEASLHVSRLDDRQLALFLAYGRLIVRVRVLEAGDATRVDTVNTQVALTRPGLYRIDVTPDRQYTTVTVREGEALVGLANGAQQVLPGQAATVTGPDPADADVRNGIGVDGFDTWSADRDRRYERSRSAAYVSRQMVGYADLDDHGTWQTYPDYGAVWFPGAVAAGWAPYRDGYWANIGAWGYTWIDHAPWGYAPYHYGRWVWIGSRWGWAPGPYVARPAWAPALVAWFGGAGWGLSVSSGAPVYGWVPLGWGEAYIPWWKRCSHSCWTRYNRPYKVDVTVRPSAPPPLPRHVHFGVPGAVTAVPQSTLVNRRPIGPNLVPVPTAVAPSAPAMSGAPAVTPGRAPAPRPQTDIGAAPPPASSFVPPSRWRGGPAGEPPATAERPSGTGGGSTPAPSRRRPAEPSAAPVAGPGRAVQPPSGSSASVPPALPAGPVSAPSVPAPADAKAAQPSAAPSQHWRGRGREGYAPPTGTGTPPPSKQAPVAAGTPFPPQAPVPTQGTRAAPPPLLNPANVAPPAAAAQQPAPTPGAAAPTPRQNGGRGWHRDGETESRPSRGRDKPEPKAEAPSGSTPK